MLCTLRPSSLGLRVKFQPPHVTRHGRCLRPAPLSRGPPDGSSLGPPPLTPSSTKAQGLGRSRARGLPGRIATPGCEHRRTWPPQPPSRGPSRRGILFSVLKASSGPSQESASSQNSLTKGPALGTALNQPGPQLEWGLQEAAVSLLVLDSSSRTEGGVG